MVWGCEIAGTRRPARSAPGKLWQVIGVTLATIADGWCTGRVLRRLIGSWVHHVLLRRPYLCLLQEEAFRLVETSGPWQRVRLPAPVADQLMMCCLLGGEAVAPLGAPWSPLVAASDAMEEAAWLCPRASHRGCCSRGLLAFVREPRRWLGAG